MFVINMMTNEDLLFLSLQILFEGAEMCSAGAC